MSKDEWIMFYQAADGTFKKYDDELDITFHFTSKEDQESFLEKMKELFKEDKKWMIQEQERS